MEDRYVISKSKYCRGIQCPKILWMDRYMPEVGEDVIPQNVVETGTRVGDLARDYFGYHSLVEFDLNKQAMAAKTRELLDQGVENIAEASFLYDRLYCAVDILHRNGDGWDIVEVKSSTSVSDIYVEDMAFQYYVLSNCGLRIKRVCNLHINKNYVRRGPLDLKELFVLEDFTAQVAEKYHQVEQNIRELREWVQTSSEPDRELNVYCEKPYPCGYRSYCGRHLPQHTVFELARMHTAKKYELYHGGIVSFEDILNNKVKINPNQKRQVESLVFHRPDQYDPVAIRAFLDTLSYPIYHLDFETFQLAVPEFEGGRPYEQIPFQYSLHIEQEDGSLTHLEFLAKEGTDPRRELAERLVGDIPAQVCVTAYNMSFEKTVIAHLAETFPDLADRLMAIHGNMKDLMYPFQKGLYYSTAMNGSYSIKYVLPALWPGDPELDYANLEGVHNGAEASAAFARLAEQPPEEIRAVRESLLRYCKLDTYAMVKVLKKLREAASCG